MTEEHNIPAVLVNEHGDVTNLSSPEDLPVQRAYDFDKGDRRRWDFNDAVFTASTLAESTGRPHQVRLSGGPLLGQKIWLIQAVERDVRIPLEVPLNLGHLRRLVARSKHLPDAAPVVMEAKARTEIGDEFGVMQDVPDSQQFYVVAHDVS
jgi:hypothetical protein